MVNWLGVVVWYGEKALWVARKRWCMRAIFSSWCVIGMERWKEVQWWHHVDGGWAGHLVEPWVSLIWQMWCAHCIVCGGCCSVRCVWVGLVCVCFCFLLRLVA